MNFSHFTLKKINTFITALLLSACLITGCGSTTEDSGAVAPDTESAEQEVITENPDTQESEISYYSQDTESDGSSSVSGTMEVHFLDVGQADCTLIICDDHNILIDAGDNDKGTYVQNYLQSKGVESLDLFVVTHFDSDHCGGADVIITKFDIGTLLVSDFENDTATCRDVFSAIKYKGCKYTTPSAGDTYQIGDMEITVIAPAYTGYSNTNNSSVGVTVKYGDTSFLFSGDCEEEAEAAIVRSGLDLDVDVYQVGHHGSRNASSVSFLNAMTPAYAVISCGEGNSYGHPHAATLNNLRAMGVQVFRTDEQGTIVASSDGNTITWNCMPSDSWQSGEQSVSDESTANARSSVSDIDAQKNSSPADEGTVYIGNSSSMKFHYPDCSSVGKMAEKNKVYFGEDVTRDDIISMGYSPCGNCNP